MRVTTDFAKSFAASWYAAWNAHNLDAIMSHYSPAIEHSSPFIKRYEGTDETALKGIERVRAYFGRALERNPTLAFIPKHLGVGLETVALVYNRMNGDLACEVFFFDDDGKIVRSVSHYQP